MKTSLSVALMSTLLVAACSSDGDTPPTNEPSNSASCGTKCDAVGEDGSVLTGLSLQTLESSDVSQQVRLIGSVSDDALFAIEDGHALAAQIYASDGASNTDFRIPATLEFDADNVGGYVSDVVEIGELIPWQRLTVEVSGTLQGKSVSETWHFFPGDDEGTPAGAAQLPAELITGAYINNYQFADGSEESFRIVADVAPELFDVLEGGEQLSVEIAAVDGASNPDFAVRSAIAYDADNVGGFISDQIDTSELLPWQKIEVRLFGAIGSVEVDERFGFVPGDIEGIHQTNETLAATAHVETLDIINRESVGGESETFRVTATLSAEADAVVQDGDVVLLEIRAADGASTDFAVPATMTYNADNVGGYVSDTIDVSELLPYLALEISLRGRVGVLPIAESFLFESGADSGVRSGD